MLQLVKSEEVFKNILKLKKLEHLAVKSPSNEMLGRMISHKTKTLDVSHDRLGINEAKDVQKLEKKQNKLINELAVKTLYLNKLKTNEDVKWCHQKNCDNIISKSLNLINPT